MKKLLFLLTFCMTLISNAQQGINYKAIIKDGSGNVVTNTLVVVQFSILQSAVQTNIYTEIHTPTTDGNGFIIVNIGEGTPISGVYTTIDWGIDEHYLNVKINTGGGLIDMGTIAFKAVPYALSVPSKSVAINDLKDGKANTTTIALGTDAGLNNSNASGTENTFIGVNAGKTNTSGNSNTYIGTESGSSSNVGTGMSNVSVGAHSGAALTNASENVIIGANAGALVTSGSGNVIIGSSAGNSQNYSNKLLIDNSGTTTPLVYGDFLNNRLFVNRTSQISNQEVFGISRTVAGSDFGGMFVETNGSETSRPFYGFAINGISRAWIEFNGTSNDVDIINTYGDFRVLYNTASKPVAGSWIANSDKRLKKNIVPLDKEDMLEKIIKMKGVSYEWNDNVTYYERPEGKQIGFIAQDLQKIWPEKVSEDHLGYLQTAYGDYDPVIIEAIKALNEKIERQEREINILKSKVLQMEFSKKQSTKLESQ
ncbi:tail fiber domain-containing protein [Xanthomarina sp. F2636L]|uniref:tail fiber domain-containing protein n=1 Tax=Xanthomarina sp. F2636L TaxID=2996018 RepID=UPI00225E0A79|nr:tail fiber domain-containing protein [Xanthomarina sp. F2636L]MCX7550974.1 tail fiber domain-containing protein [Xanthomarina sp. F2636L]